MFAPTRQDYLELLTRVPIRPAELAFDIGTGTGVVAAMLARAGVSRVVATDVSARAVACARDNLDRLALGHRVDVQHRDLFPPGRADLVVANPPWVPGSAHSDLDRGVFDPAGRVLDRLVLGWVDTSGRTGRRGWSCPISPNASSCATPTTSRR